MTELNLGLFGVITLILFFNDSRVDKIAVF